MGTDTTCPLCGTINEEYTCTRYNRKIRLSNNLELSALELICALFINIGLIAIAVNIATGISQPWFLLVISFLATIYSIILICAKRKSLLLYIETLFVILEICLILSQYFVFKGNWAFDYAIPLLIIIESIIILCSLLFGKSKFLYGFSTVWISAHRAFYLLILYLCGLCGVSFASNALVIAALTIFLLLIINTTIIFVFVSKSRISKALK